MLPSVLGQLVEQDRSHPRTLKKAALWCLGAAIWFMASALLAQQAPDAGSILRQLEPPRPTLPKKPPPELQLETPARPELQPAPEVHFILKAFRITGETVFAESDLLALVLEYVGKEVRFAELEEAAARITRYYREHGYPVARAYLPAQDIQDGVVEIAVIEGRFGKVELDNRSRVRDSVIDRYIGPLQGRLVEEKSLERRLLLLYDLPGISEPKATLKPGEQVGESDLLLDLAPARAASGSVELDNYGNSFTGQYRQNGQASLFSPSGYGDLLSAEVTHGDPGLNYGRLTYQLPLGGNGLKAGASYKDLHYQLGKSFAALDASGSAQSSSAFTVYPFARSRRFNLYGQLGLDYGKLDDKINATATDTHKTTTLGTFVLFGDYQDSLGGGGASAFSLSFGRGRLNIDSADAKAIDAATARTDGAYEKWNLSYVRLQHITDAASLYVSFAGQVANKNLVSVEKFILGGPYGVRAYPTGEAPGDSGYLLTAELRYALPVRAILGGVQLFGFLDLGETKLNQNPFAAGVNDRRLSDGGVGLNWGKPKNFVVRLMLAAKIGSESATSDTDRSFRTWIQAVKFF